MATIAIGDIHGNLAPLTEVLDQIRGESGRGDTIVFLGDYIDRGPDSRGCVDAILGFRRDVDSNVVCLVGNHEDWLLRTLHDYGRHMWLLGMDVYPTIRSYSADAALTLRLAAASAGGKLYEGDCQLPYDAFFDEMPAEHVQFFEGLRPYHRSADCLCVHGGLNTLVTRVEEQERYDLIWGTPDFPKQYAGADVVVYGHKNNATLSADDWPGPTFIGRTIGVDTISHGVLTAVRLPDGRIFQSARHARRRDSSG